MAGTDNCEMWADKLVARQPQDLSPTEWAALNAHVASCPNCSAIRQDYDLLISRIRTLRVPTSEIVPPDPATALWYTQPARLSVPEQRNSENSGQRINRIRQRLPFRGREVAIALVAASILIALVTGLQIHSVLQRPAPVAVKQMTTTTAVKGFTTICPHVPTQDSTSCQAHYTGSFMSFLDHSMAPMTLFLQQNQTVIRGSCTLSRPFNVGNAPLSGSVDGRGNVKFNVPLNPLNLTLHFIGSVHADGSMSGTYITSAGQQGTWNVKLG